MASRKSKTTTEVEGQIIWDTLKGQTFEIDLLEELDNDYNMIRDIVRNTTKPTKVQQAYHDEENEKLMYVQDKIKKVVRKALGNTLEAYEATDTYGNMNKKFKIKVYVSVK